MDFLIDTAADNTALVAEAIREFSFGALPIEPRELEQRAMIFQIGRPPNRIDILTSIDGVEFATAWAARVQAEAEGTRLWVIDRESLLRNKLASGRPQDLSDARQIQKRTKSPKGD
jgi:hypothetical protein